MIRACFFVGQGLLAFLPALVVILIARTDAERAGEFSVTMGVVGAVFSIAYFGQRAYVAVRGFDRIPCRAAIAFRAVLSLVAAAVTLVLAKSMGLATAVVVYAIGLKLSESIIDLWVGIRIRLTSDRESSSSYLLVTAVRAIAITGPLLWLGAEACIQSRFAPAYLAGLALVAYGLAHTDSERLGHAGRYRFAPRALLGHAWEMRSFVSATAVCALLSALPRVVLPYSEGDAYSAAALALSIVPIFGLAFQALWLSRLKSMARESDRQVRHFVLEVVGLAIACVLVQPLWEWLAGIVYALEPGEPRERFAHMLSAGVVLSAAVCLSNLFKLTMRPRNESFSYAIGLSVLLAAVFVLETGGVVAMGSAAAGMLVFVGLAFRAKPASDRRHELQPS